MSDKLKEGDRVEILASKNKGMHGDVGRVYDANRVLVYLDEDHNWYEIYHPTELRRIGGR